jgi:hypothetical protein
LVIGVKNLNIVKAIGTNQVGDIMYSAVKGVFENGQVFLEEASPTNKKVKAVVLFLNEEPLPIAIKPVHNGVKIGSLAGKEYGIPDDFNKPLDDLKEYM